MGKSRSIVPLDIPRYMMKLLTLILSTMVLLSMSTVHAQYAGIDIRDRQCWGKPDGTECHLRTLKCRARWCTNHDNKCCEDACWRNYSNRCRSAIGAIADKWPGK